jgi:hypothetical protein
VDVVVVAASSKEDEVGQDVVFVSSSSEEDEVAVKEDEVAVDVAVDGDEAMADVAVAAVDVDEAMVVSDDSVSRTSTCIGSFIARW